MYYLKTTASFDSAHFLAGYSGKCRNIHGHRWNVEVCVCGEELQESGEKRGMIVDFGDLKKAVRNIADNLDHALIYEKNSLKPSTVMALESEDFRLVEVDFRPTAENFACYFCELLSLDGFNISSVAVYETPENCAVYEAGRSDGE
ncbi:MAG: 6-carboxytetrahydropterin synthase QueD [Ruminococcus sp.]|nr:6-carboxytetrahydropterin synthase QueD [Ruminococcus sp.]